MKNKILELRARGLSYNQIVKELGCSKGTVAYHCGVGQKEKTRKREKDKRNLKVRYIQKHKQDSGCIDCKENYPYWMLELDHVRGSKVANVSTMTATHNLEEIKAEIAKCDVVCANCHRIRTWQRIQSSNHSTMDIDSLYT